MTRIDALRHKLDRMITAIDAQLPQEESEGFDYTLFLPEEAEQLKAFGNVINIRQEQPYSATQRFTDSELDELHNWLDLYRALQAYDQERAAFIRRRMQTSIEQLIEMFRSLDLTMLPDDYNMPGIRIEEENCLYCLNRAGYRNILINSIERGRIQRYVIDDMWRWVLYFEQHFRRRAS